MQGNYRSEIDGLRAIAVGLVILFHLQLSRLGSGGYVGVDIFFVISGYLITGHLRHDVLSGLRGMLDFYRRRIVRIFPALFVVYLVCLAMALACIFPSQLTSFRNALLSSTWFVSNIYLYETVGYFDFRARSNPLIHTWSLSIEEQFYIGLPFILLAVRHLAVRTQLLCLAALVIASFVGAQFLLAHEKEASFYLVPWRAWELLAGSLLSYRSTAKLPGGRAGAEFGGYAGLAMIAAAALILDEKSSFPGAAALLPVGGTILLLAATDGTDTSVRRILSLPPIRFAGLISYSLYLWHWPVIVFSRYVHPIQSRTDKLAAIGLMVVLAVASWALVEQPARRRGRRMSRGLVLAGAGAAMLAMTLVAVASPWIGRRIWPENRRAEAMLAGESLEDIRRSWHAGSCFAVEVDKGETLDAPRCLDPVAGRTNVLLVGDSHAAMLRWGLEHRYPDVHWLQASGGNCAPLPRLLHGRCGQLLGAALSRVGKGVPIDAIVLSALWMPGDAEQLTRIVQGFRPLARQVIVAGPPPQFLLQFPEVAARAIYHPGSDEFDRFRDRSSGSLEAPLRAAAEEAGARYVSVRQTLCNPRCAISGPRGKPILSDYDHLSPDGSLLFAERLPPDLFARPSAKSAP